MGHFLLQNLPIIWNAVKKSWNTTRKCNKKGFLFSLGELERCHAAIAVPLLKGEEENPIKDNLHSDPEKGPDDLLINYSKQNAVGV